VLTFWSIRQSTDPSINEHHEIICITLQKPSPLQQPSTIDTGSSRDNASVSQTPRTPKTKRSRQPSSPVKSSHSKAWAGWMGSSLYGYCWLWLSASSLATSSPTSVQHCKRASLSGFLYSLVVYIINPAHDTSSDVMLIAIALSLLVIMYPVCAK